MNNFFNTYSANITQSEPNYKHINLLSKITYTHTFNYPTPLNLNYNWSFGALTGGFFALQIITGIFLAMHYIPNIGFAFESVEHMMRDVNFGFILRYAHANGASMIFIMIYIHIAKGLFYRSYSGQRKHLWFSGIVLFLLMIITAFVGYVLPWGQMSFWGATVITNLITAIPYVGNSIAIWIWGDFSVGNPTLNRFFSFHYLLPFIIAGLALVHLALLHHTGSTNTIGIISYRDTVRFLPYFGIKDLFIILAAMVLFFYLLFFNPNLLGHSDNYIPADPLVTPAHIVPEWYFLPFYAILRAIPNKLGGVLAMVGAIAFLAIIALISDKTNSAIRSTRFSPQKQLLFWAFLINFLILGFIGGNVAEEPYIITGRISAILYFVLLAVREFVI